MTESLQAVAPMPILQRSCACGKPAPAGGECAECKKKKKMQEALRRSASSNAGPEMAPPIVHDVLRSAGRPLDKATREFFESRFAYDFSKVRIHSDSRAAESARSVNALAYTVGNRIAFDSGRFEPATPRGRRLLAHELTHVIQQGSQTTDLAGGLAIGPVNDPLESQAESTAAWVADSGGAAPAPGHAATGVARATLQRACGADGIGKQTDCVGTSGDTPGERYLFVVNCDTMVDQAKLEKDANGYKSGDVIEIHGSSSIEGDAEFNNNLSCARAHKAMSVIESKVSGLDFKLFSHGATAGQKDENRCATVVNRGAPPQPKEDPKPNPDPIPSPGTEPQPHPCGPGTDDPFCFKGGDARTPCAPFADMNQALAIKRARSLEVPNAMAGTTRCWAVKNVWDTYFAQTSTPFAFDPFSCVAAAAKGNTGAAPVAAASANELMDDVMANLPYTLREATPAPSVIRKPLEEAIDASHKPELHPKILFSDAATNAAGNLAGGISGSKFGMDDRIMQGQVVIQVDSIGSLTHRMSGKVRWMPHVHVKDTVDFCPGGLGGDLAQTVTIDMSKLEVMHLVEPVPITIDYNLELHEQPFTDVVPKFGPQVE